ASDNGFWEIPCNPPRRRTGDQINPRIFNQVIPCGLSSLFEGSLLGVPQANQEVNHVAILGIDQVAELGGLQRNRAHGVVVAAHLEALCAGSKRSDQRWPANHVGAKVDSWDLTQDIHRNGYGGGFADDSWWGNEDDIVVDMPLEILHVYPDSPPERPCECGYPRPEVHSLGGLAEPSVVHIGFEPVGEVS